MWPQAETPNEMINDLLLNQCFTKIDISKIIHASTKKIDCLLSNNDSERTEYLKDHQFRLLSKLYHRMKLFENRIDDFLI
jgi:hypothetical protein